MTSPASSTRRRRRRPWLRLALLALLALLIWLYFSGRLPRFGSDVGDAAGEDASRVRIVKTGGPTRVVDDAPEVELAREGEDASDADRGRRARFRFLVRSAELHDARVLALALLEEVPATERAARRRELGVDTLLVPALVRRLEEALAESRLKEARSCRADLLALRAAKALERFDLGEKAVVEERVLAARERMAEAARAVLPLELEASRRLERIEGGAFVLRVRTPSAAYRYHRRGVDDFDFAAARAVLVEASGQDPRSAALQRAIVAWLEAQDRPLEARLMRDGVLASGR